MVFLYRSAMLQGHKSNKNQWCIRPGEHTKSYWKWPFIVDLPMKMVIFHSYVSSPEGILPNDHFLGGVGEMILLQWISSYFQSHVFQCFSGLQEPQDCNLYVCIITAFFVTTSLWLHEMIGFTTSWWILREICAGPRGQTVSRSIFIVSPGVEELQHCELVS